MSERVLAIVNLIAQYVLGAKEAAINEQELVTELMAVGYEAEEISDAFSWMETTALQPQDGTSLADPLLELSTYRVFDIEEQQALSSAAQGFLIKVRSMGLLTDEAQEEIIDRALGAAVDPLTEQEIKLITSLTLLARSDRLWLREIDCFLDNDWARIYH